MKRVKEKGEVYIQRWKVEHGFYPLSLRLEPALGMGSTNLPDRSKLRDLAGHSRHGAKNTFERYLNRSASLLGPS